MFQPEVVSAFEHAYPRVVIDTTGASAKRPYQVATYAQSPPGSPLPATSLFADLTVALRSLNFQPDALFPGTLASWSNHGHVLGVPTSVTPWGVRWRQDAFTAAGLPPPSADWTFDDFQQDCLALQALATSGRVRGLTAALGPMSPARHPYLDT